MILKGEAEGSGPGALLHLMEAGLTCCCNPGLSAAMITAAEAKIKT